MTVIGTMEDAEVFIVYIILVLGFALATYVFIKRVWVPFTRQRDYLKAEIIRSKGREREYWSRQLRRLYFTSFTVFNFTKKTHKRKNKKRSGAFGAKLCTKCRIGMESIALDEYAVCPYKYCHNGKYCTKYEKIKKTGLVKQFSVWLNKKGVF